MEWSWRLQFLPLGVKIVVCDVGGLFCHPEPRARDQRAAICLGGRARRQRDENPRKEPQRSLPSTFVQKVG